MLRQIKHQQALSKSGTNVKHANYIIWLREKYNKSHLPRHTHTHTQSNASPLCLTEFVCGQLTHKPKETANYTLTAVTRVCWKWYSNNKF